MLKPVMKSMKDKDGIIGFAMSAKEASKILGARAKEYDVRINGNFSQLNTKYEQEYLEAKAASVAATEALTAKGSKSLSKEERAALERQIINGEKLIQMNSRCAGRERAFELQRKWTEKATEMCGGEPRLALPHVVNHIDGIYLATHLYLLAREIPIGRTVKEALTDPIGHYRRSRKKSQVFSGIKAVKTTVTLDKTYKREKSARKFYSALIAADAVRLNQSEEDSAWRAVLTYWKLDPVALRRDFAHEKKPLNTQFDLWGNWHSEEIAKMIGDGRRMASDLTTPDEGSGRTMGL